MTSLLEQHQLDYFIEKNPSWIIDNKTIKKEFKFENFIEAFGFMTKVAIISESACHHPEWKNVYSEVTIDLTTHELNGISNLDLKLAKSIDEIIKNKP